MVDCDVHQGDGTHAALAGDDEAFTLSLNGGGNYPFRRVAGDLERDLPDGTDDDGYLDALAELLPVALTRSPASFASTWRARIRSRAIAWARWPSRRRGSRAATGWCARRCCARASRCA